MNIKEDKQGLIWIKGFSASGKSTVARRVEYLLKQDGYNIISLDGDELRGVFGDIWGYETKSRRELASVYFRLCSYLSSQGYITVISAVAMFDFLEEWVQINIPNSLQVFLDVPLDERQKRDAKTKKLFINEEFNDNEYDFPKNPDMVLRNYGEMVPDIAAKQIIESYCHLHKLTPDRSRTKHWKKYYANDIAPSVNSSFSEYAILQMKRGQHILEVGCGNGRDAVFFASSGIKVDAIDRSQDAISLCNDKYLDSDVKFHYGKIDSLIDINNNNKYDHIYCRFVIHAMPIEEENALISASFDLLKEGGCIFLECRSINDPLARKGEIISSTERVHGHYRRFIIPEEFQDRLIERGFKVISLHEEDGVAKYGDDDPVVIRVIATK